MSAPDEPAAVAKPPALGGMVGALAALGQLLSDAAFSGDTAKVDHLLREKKIPINCKDNVRCFGGPDVEPVCCRFGSRLPALRSLRNRKLPPACFRRTASLRCIARA